MKKISISIVLVLALVISLAGCGNTNTGGSPQSIIIATGGTGGVYFPLGGEFAKIFQSKANVNATAQVTGASVENMQLLSKGQVQLAFTQNDIAYYAVNGTEIFDKKLENISGIGTLYPEIIQLVVSADSGINSLADLKGKKVSVGAPGSGNEANSKQILNAAGLSYDDIDEQLKSYSDSADAFKDGLIDAMFVTSGIPNSSVADIAVTKGIKVLSLDDAVIEKLKSQYPFFVDATVPKGTYQGQENDAKTVAVMATLAVNSTLDENFVYNLTKALYENLSSIQHAKGKEIKLEEALTGMTLPVHPGAQKYFDEKGVKK